MTVNIQPVPAQWRSTVPLYIHLGFDLDTLDDGHSQVRLRFQPHLGNSRGDVHGGTVAAIIDAAMSQAVRSLVDREVGVATMTMNLNYLAPAKGEIICKGTVIKRGRSIMFTEAEVFDNKLLDERRQFGVGCDGPRSVDRGRHDFGRGRQLRQRRHG